MSGAPDGPGPWPRASTGLLAVIGWPVDHSLSPVLHNAALRHDGRDLVYLALPVLPDDLHAVVAALGAMGAVGANVTVPHKQAVAAACHRLTDEARLVGAVNTLTWTDEGLVGHNTDTGGLQRALTEVGVTADADRAVLLGTGGAARAAVVALVRLGLDVLVVGRRMVAASEVADVGREAAAGAGLVEACDLADPVVAGRVAAAGVVVNATTLGMQREDLPAPFMALQAGQVALDLVYSPPNTPFLEAARVAGAAAHHGLGMLVHQAAEAYEGWTGAPAPVDVMRAAVEAALDG